MRTCVILKLEDIIQNPINMNKKKKIHLSIFSCFVAPDRYLANILGTVHASYHVQRWRTSSSSQYAIGISRNHQPSPSCNSSQPPALLQRNIYMCSTTDRATPNAATQTTIREIQKGAVRRRERHQLCWVISSANTISPIKLLLSFFMTSDFYLFFIVGKLCILFSKYKGVRDKSKFILLG